MCRGFVALEAALNSVMEVHIMTRRVGYLPKFVKVAALNVIYKISILELHRVNSFSLSIGLMVEDVSSQEK